MSGRGTVECIGLEGLWQHVVAEGPKRRSCARHKCVCVSFVFLVALKRDQREYSLLGVP